MISACDGFARAQTAGDSFTATFPLSLRKMKREIAVAEKASRMTKRQMDDMWAEQDVAVKKLPSLQARCVIFGVALMQNEAELSTLGESEVSASPKPDF
jgi:hypothetical protein